MLDAGLPVPPGVFLTTGFFEPWFDEITASATWQALVDEAPERWASLCAELKGLCPALELTATQQRALENLRESLSAMGERSFAVRSSSPEEDLAEASFAGGYETGLNVRPAELEGAVRRCFASSLDERVLVYKRQHASVCRRRPVEGDDPQRAHLASGAFVVRGLHPVVRRGAAARGGSGAAARLRGRQPDVREPLLADAAGQSQAPGQPHQPQRRGAGRYHVHRRRAPLPHAEPRLAAALPDRRTSATDPLVVSLVRLGGSASAAVSPAGLARVPAEGRRLREGAHGLSTTSFLSRSSGACTANACSDRCSM